MPSSTDRTYPLSIDQGDDEEFVLTLQYDDGELADLTGCEAEFLIEWGASKNQATGLVVAASGTLVLSSPSNGVWVDDTASQITITLTAAQTATIPASGVYLSSQNASYQLRLTLENGNKETLLAGPLQVVRRIVPIV